MQSSVNTKAVVAKYAAFLKAGSTYGEALRHAAQQLGGTQCSTLLEALAKVHAKHYGCNYSWDSNGRAVFFTGFESTRETRHDAARMSWARNVMVHFLGATKPITRKHVVVSPKKVDAIVNVMAGLTKAEANALLAAVRASLAFE